MALSTRRKTTAIRPVLCHRTTAQLEDDPRAVRRRGEIRKTREAQGGVLQRPDRRITCQGPTLVGSEPKFMSLVQCADADANFGTLSISGGFEAQAHVPDLQLACQDPRLGSAHDVPTSLGPLHVAADAALQGVAPKLRPPRCAGVVVREGGGDPRVHLCLRLQPWSRHAVEVRKHLGSVSLQLVKGLSSLRSNVLWCRWRGVWQEAGAVIAKSTSNGMLEGRCPRVTRCQRHVLQAK
mmetsp:Transcript_125720/g.367345  ORF Transcript_125720/g.367345 Transcript_125720/m.367345 type:complete len:238 (-) Transcript_125720:1185-1898(-)